MALRPGPRICPCPATPVSSLLSTGTSHNWAAPQSLRLGTFIAPLTPQSALPVSSSARSTQRDLESHQDYLSHEGTKGSDPCLANSSSANWLFGKIQKTFSTRSNVLNSRVTAIRVLLGRRVRRSLQCSQTHLSLRTRLSLVPWGVPQTAIPTDNLLIDLSGVSCF